GNYAALAIDAAAWWSAEWAHQRGLFAEVHEDVGALDARVTALTRQLAASNLEAMAALKRVLWEGTEHWRDLLPERARLSGRLVVSSAARQAIERISR
ncbi:MAG TPA: enoyl-CoA hydratase/isomerase family protein, partial [Gemmatimonadales bacterium]|nr:enoyl-CoA hydratase/isomerase family protein [Gemmatimonadales bacterium]